MSNNSLFKAAAICLIGGSTLFYASKRVMCVPFIGECYFAISGSNILDAKGVRMNSALAESIEPAAYGVFGLGGITLLAALIRPSTEKQ